MQPASTDIGAQPCNGNGLTTTGAQIYNDAVSFGGATTSRTISASALTY